MSLYLVPVALAAMVTALAMWRRPRVAAACTATAAMSLFTAAAGLAAAGGWIVALAVLLPGGVAGALAAWQALTAAKQPRADAQARPYGGAR